MLCPPLRTQADLLKLSDADLEWLLGIDIATAFINPCVVGGLCGWMEVAEGERRSGGEVLAAGRGLRPACRPLAVAPKICSWSGVAGSDCCSGGPPIIPAHVLAPQVAQAFPSATGVLITAGDEGAAYCFRSPTKGESAGYVPVFKVRAPLSSCGPWCFVHAWDGADSLAFKKLSACEPHPAYHSWEGGGAPHLHQPCLQSVRMHRMRTLQQQGRAPPLRVPR